MIRFPVPEEVFLDTSLVIAALYPGTTNSRSALEFCGELRRSKTAVYFSEALRLELSHGIRRLATKSELLPSDVRKAFDLDRWGTNPLIRHRWLTTGVRKWNDFLLQFSTFVEVPMRTELWHQSIDIMAAEGFDATDALHLATARSLGVNDFCTSDSDFRRITSPQVHLIRDV